MDIEKLIENAIKEEGANKVKYKKAAAEAEDPATRAMLEQLARDEEKHERILKDALIALKLIKGE